MKRIYLKPRTPKLKIPYPQGGGRYLKPEGAWVTESSYWVRRQIDGDAIPATDEELAELAKQEAKLAEAAKQAAAEAEIPVDPPAAEPIKSVKEAATEPREE